MVEKTLLLFEIDFSQIARVANECGLRGEKFIRCDSDQVTRRLHLYFEPSLVGNDGEPINETKDSFSG